MFSKQFIRAIQAVAGDCLPDMEGPVDDECLAEVAMDAGRLTTWGFPDADAELRVLIAAHGYPAVLKEAAKHMPC